MNNENKNQTKPDKIKRRDWIKSMATLPILGGLAFSAFGKRAYDQEKKKQVLANLGLDNVPTQTYSTGRSGKSELLRLGIIGFGNRGEFVARTLGYPTPEWIAGRKKKNKFQEWVQNQEDLNVAITGICDVFDQNAQRGVIASDCELRPSRIKAKLFKDYRELLASDEIDAVVITTPDFHHARMTIDAVKSGKHVYCEKGMTRTEEEVYEVEAAVKDSNIVFQLGHQYHQNSSYFMAKEIIRRNVLGKITLIESTTNRNSPHGAWIRHLDDSGKPKPGDANSIDWQRWLGESPKVDFDLDRFYNWSKWWDYATGLSGQLMSHELDTVNQLLGLGIPHSCVASGGIYFYKDNREIPDVFHAAFEFPQKDLSFVYSASLASAKGRGRLFMGHDGSMNLGNTLEISIDPDSTKYKEEIDKKIFDISQPTVAFNPGKNKIDAVTSATEKYYASRGLYYTYRNGKKIDVTFLHLKEWIAGIREGSVVSVPIEKGVETTIACHMATKSYRENRKVHWDPIKRRII